MPVKVEFEWCKGCGVCIEKCPMHALAQGKETNKKGYIPPVMVPDNKCNNCRLCEIICPDFALGIYIEEDDNNGKGD